MSDLVNIEGAPRPKIDRHEIVRVAINLATICAVTAVVLGGVYLVTERVAQAARLAREKQAISGMLALPPGASVLEVSQFLVPDKAEVLYRARPYGDEKATPRDVAFSFTGQPRDAAAAAASERLVPLGRLFVASVNGSLAGFVVEGDTRGYKAVIRFFVALDSAFVVQGVKVIQHEEDPGLGAEVATGWFQAQFVGRDAAEIANLDVTKDPMPEDWRAALRTYATETPGEWREQNAGLIRRERDRPIYAVTGATISSRALTRGVRTTVDHFRRRWALLATRLGESS